MTRATVRGVSGLAAVAVAAAALDMPVTSLFRELAEEDA